MKSNIIKALLATLLAPALAAAAPTSVAWPFNAGQAGQRATADASLFSFDIVKTAGLAYAGTREPDGVAQTRLQPTEEVKAPTDAACAQFIVIPRPGVTFRPSRVSFTASRYGTGGSNIDYGVAAGYGEPAMLQTGLKPARDNETPASSEFSSQVEGIAATADAPLRLVIYIYNLAPTKQVGLSGITVEGEATGVGGEPEYCTLSVGCEPEGAAAIAQEPEGTRFVKGTPVTLSATVNEGYRFLSWQDGDGGELASQKTYAFPLMADAEVVAACRQLPVMDRGCYDFIVPDDGNVKEAIEAANERTDDSRRYRIFIRPGDHQMPASKTATSLGSDGVEYPSPNNFVKKSNLSLIGLDFETTSVRNTLPQVYLPNGNNETHPLEGNNPDALSIESGVTGTYFQGITVKSDMKDKTGRNAALKDRGDKTIMKDACLWAYQDTYVSSNNSGRFYFEGGRLRGRTDFLCGGGDAFYQGVELVMCEQGGALTAPGSARKYGYVFRDCRITGPEPVDGNYTLGRPWGQGTPSALYIDTEMEAAPSGIGWSEMGDGYPARFAEYGSHRPDGTPIDLGGRKTDFKGHANNPELTAEEADRLTVEEVLGGDDGWNPAELARQCAAPRRVAIDGSTISWEASEGAIGYVVCQGGDAVAFTEATSCQLPGNITGEPIYVRAANEMGGLGEPSEAVVATGMAAIEASGAATEVYDLAGRRLPAAAKGLSVVRTVSSDGTLRGRVVVR